MPHIALHPEKAADLSALPALCPFGAIELSPDGTLSINAGCRMCRQCVRKGGGVFEFVDDAPAPAIDKSAWRGIAVAAEFDAGAVHPVSYELLGKARELAAQSGEPVQFVLIGNGAAAKADEALAYGADDVYVYDNPAFAHFRIEPFAAALEDFIRSVRPSAVLVGGTPLGRSLAPRVAARFQTGLTADCTSLGISGESDLDQIRPAYGGNIMAHIHTPNHRPQFATVRYKIFSAPPKESPHGTVHRCSLPEAKLASALEVLGVREKARETGIEEAEVVVVAGRGVKRREDLAMLRELADLLGGRLATSRPLVEAGWSEARNQVGLSGRTVKPKLLLAFGVSGAIQFVAGMSGSEKIVAVNTDPDAPIFKVAHIAVHADLYDVVPRLIQRIRETKHQEEA